MRNIRLTLEYDGTAYGGWQVQPNARSVQAEVERAVGALTKTPTRVTASGRTDAGVHALGQTAHFFADSGVPLTGFLRGLNSLLPKDITVSRVDEMPLGFDSRRSAREKTYRYVLHRGPAPSAFARRTSWRPRGVVDYRAVARAAPLLAGTHDYGSFRATGCGAATTVRTVRSVEVLERGCFVEVVVRGNGFLRHMVRIMVGTLVDLGQGRFTPSDLEDLLARPDRNRAGRTAPPQGLFLDRVEYDVEPLDSAPCLL